MSGTATPRSMIVPSVSELLLPPDNFATLRKPPQLSGQDDKFVRLAEHFDAPGYELPVKEGASEKRGLSEREKMFLVSHSTRSRRGLENGVFWWGSVAESGIRQSKETFAR